MKPFDLKAALNGSPVQLRNGACAWVYGNASVVPGWEHWLDGPPLRGIYKGDDNIHYDNFGWELDGKFDPEDEHPMDIIGMWEEPEFTQKEILDKAYQEGLIMGKWIKVNKHLPKIGDVVLGYDSADDVMFLGKVGLIDNDPIDDSINTNTVKYLVMFDQFDDNYTEGVIVADYWQPLPQRPKF